MLSASADPGYRGGHPRLAPFRFRFRTPVIGSVGSGRGGTISPERVDDSSHLFGSSLVFTASLRGDTDELPGVCNVPMLVAIGGRLPRTMTVRSPRSTFCRDVEQPVSPVVPAFSIASTSAAGLAIPVRAASEARGPRDSRSGIAPSRGFPGRALARGWRADPDIPQFPGRPPRVIFASSCSCQSSRT
jgi:hypothetical protein